MGKEGVGSLRKERLCSGGGDVGPALIPALIRSDFSEKCDEGELSPVKELPLLNEKLGLK